MPPVSPPIPLQTPEELLPLGINLQLVEDIDFDQGHLPPAQLCNLENQELPENAAPPPTKHGSTYPQHTNHRKPLRYCDENE